MEVKLIRTPGPRSIPDLLVRAQKEEVASFTKLMLCRCVNVIFVKSLCFRMTLIYVPVSGVNKQTNSTSRINVETHFG